MINWDNVGQASVGQDEDEYEVLCEWYALCTNDAVGMVWHPILAAVPCCARCATKHDLVINPAKENV